MSLLQSNAAAEPPQTLTSGAWCRPAALLKVRARRARAAGKRAPPQVPLSAAPALLYSNKRYSVYLEERIEWLRCNWAGLQGTPIFAGTSQVAQVSEQVGPQEQLPVLPHQTQPQKKNAGN